MGGARRRTDDTTGDERSRPITESSWFLMVAGGGRVTSHPLQRGETVIGRAPECDVVIDDRVFSRRHAIIELGEKLAVRDLGSKNGLRVGGAVVRGGDAVPLDELLGFHIGGFSFLLVAVASGTETTSHSSADGTELVPDPTPASVSSFVRNVADSTLSVLILGETGVGKEVLAETIHLLSKRTGQFSRINCAAFSESLLESELFGYEQGAFTGAASTRVGLLEASDGGTVFLDELGELPLATQAKLLRAVDAKEIFRIGSTRAIKLDARFIAATNRDLAGEIGAGRFRADLYFRLAGVTFHIPALRERKQMIGTLALSFLRSVAGAPKSLSPDVIAALEAHPFPGNVRELRAMIERACLLAKGGELRRKHFSFPKPIPAPDPGPEDRRWSREELRERNLILRTLEEFAGNQTRAAKALGMSRTTFVQRLKAYCIPRPRV